MERAEEMTEVRTGSEFASVGKGMCQNGMNECCEKEGGEVLFAPALLHASFLSLLI